MQVVNVDSYGGVDKAVAAGVVYVGRNRGSALGNPFVLGRDGTREQVVALYRRWLWDKIQACDGDVMTALWSLREGDLVGCHCAPAKCHADVVIRAARWLRVKRSQDMQRMRSLGLLGPA